MKERPLSAHALDCLRYICKHGPIPRQEINPGVAGALEKRGLVETFMGKTPYRTRTGDVQFLRATESGREMVK